MEMYDSSYIDATKYCDMCNASLIVPKFTPCCCQTICAETCEKELFKVGTKFKCPLCNQMSKITKPLIVNKTVERILSCKRIKIDSNYLDTKVAYDATKLMLDDVQWLLDNPDTFIQEHFDDLKGEIEEHTNRIIKQLQEKKVKVLKALEEEEKNCHDYIKAMPEDFGFQKFKKIVEPFLSTVNSTVAKVLNDVNNNNLSGSSVNRYK